MVSRFQGWVVLIAVLAIGFGAFQNELPVAAAGEQAQAPANLNKLFYIPLVSLSNSLTGMVFIPAGSFSMGCDPNHNSTWPCYGGALPLHTVTLDSYLIDRYEVTNARYAQCEAAGRCSAPAWLSSNTRPWYHGNPEYDNYPVIFVTWNQAAAYCAWENKRLPSEAEWEKAARGPTVRAFPWGDAAMTCTLANAWVDNYCVNDTSAVGSHPAGASPYGVMDMAGNVLEWVNDWFGLNYYSTSPVSNPTGPVSGSYRMLRGGSWSYPDSSQLVAVRENGTPTSRNNIIGFRCAVSAP